MSESKQKNSNIIDGNVICKIDRKKYRSKIYEKINE